MKTDDLLRAELRQLRRQLEQARQASNRWCAVAGSLMAAAGLREGFFSYRSMFESMRERAPTLTPATAKRGEDGEEEDGLHVVMRDKQNHEEN